MKKLKNILILNFFTFFSFSQRIMAAPSCKKVLGAEIIQFMIDIFDMVKWIALAIGVILGMLDFFKAIAASKEDALSKAAQNFAKRLIAIVILFILPVLLDWILNISGIEHGGTCLE